MSRLKIRVGGRRLPVRVAAPSGGSPSPTTVAVAGPSGLTTGTPGTYTYTLDHPAQSGGVSIVPSATGFAATFGTNPVAIASGSSSGTTDVTASTAASGTVTGTSTPTLAFTPESVTSSTGVSAPGIPNLLASPDSSTSILLSGSPGAGGTPASYTLQRSPAGAGTWMTVASPASLPLPDTGLASLTSYDYRMSATNGAGTSSYSAASNATTYASGSKVPLSASDFSLVGHYLYDNDLGQGLTFTGQMTIRHIDGELRFLAIAFGESVTGKGLIEFRLPAGPADGREIGGAQRTNLWVGGDVWPSFSSPDNLLAGHHCGIWYEELGGNTGRLWGSMGLDYPDSTNSGMTQAVTARVLDDDGTVSGAVGAWGFQGVSQRCVMGRVQKNPAWFQAAYGVGPYLYGFGGYTSLIQQGGTGSMGLFAIAGPDVTTYAVGSVPYWAGVGGADFNVPASDFKVLADHRSGIENGDFSAVTPPAWDRGWALSTKKNFYDDPNTPANGALSNPAVRAFYDANPVSSAAVWKNPGADGHGRFDWGDSYFASGSWVDGPSKQGLVCVASINEVWGGYTNSVIDGHSGGAEIHAFDPADLGAVAGGTKSPWNVQPHAMKSITADLTGLGLVQLVRGAESGGPVSSCFDPATKTLWINFTGVDGAYQCALLEYSVNC